MRVKKVFNFDKNDINSDFNLRKYTHIRWYHGCSPINLNEYYNNRIIPINKKFELEQSIKLLSSDKISADKVKKHLTLIGMNLERIINVFVWSCKKKSCWIEVDVI